MAGLAGRMLTGACTHPPSWTARLTARGVEEETFESGSAAMAMHGYPPEVIAAVPVAAAQRFLGLGNLWRGHESLGDRRVLDVGCGAGVDLVAATVLTGPGTSVVGLDKRSDLLSIAHAACPKAILVRGDIARVPFRESSFDLVLANGLPPLQRPVSLARTVAQLQKLSRPGGATVVTVIVVAAAVEAALTDAFPGQTPSVIRGMATLISGKPTTHDVRTAFELSGASVSMSLGRNPYRDSDLRQATALVAVRALQGG